MPMDIVATKKTTPFVNNQPLVTWDLALKILVPLGLVAFFIISCQAWNLFRLFAALQPQKLRHSLNGLGGRLQPGLFNLPGGALYPLVAISSLSLVRWSHADGNGDHPRL